MYKFLTKNGQAIAFGLGVVIVLLFLISVVPNISTFSDQPKEVQYETGIFNLGLQGAIALAVLAAVAMVGFGLFHVATNFKGSLKELAKSFKRRFTTRIFPESFQVRQTKRRLSRDARSICCAFPLTETLCSAPPRP